ncbi:GNAT family N-acetyltransferase [Bacillus haikouensis]|jgi:ribosomal protein S18 acetylase RimI-like enzyme|uniref:GNAT family N-acetyltransferase n=1 Tax=Bacillus haikouensis TaxID=1510468 RepID=UPI0015552321|nr:GNAT family N-acetyltransferase [Bacillus haikouensis]NQD67959.1 GNAT family N-acetyltransferase [Bacillus haikouensis]
MLRFYCEEDKGNLIKLIEKMEIKEGVGELEEVIANSQKIMLYDQNGIKGFSYYSTYNNDEEDIAQISLFVDFDYRLSGKLISESDSDFVSVYMRVESENPIPFAEKMGFTKWWGSPELIYRGGAFPKTDVEFVKYEEKFFEKFLKVVQDSYYELHEINDMKPYLAPEYSVNEYKLNNKDNVYLVLDNEEIVASVTTGKGEVDNSMVAPSYQGKGYGRKALQFGMNKMLEEGYKEIRICFVEGNKNAEKLYTSIGFKPLHNTQVYRKFL